MPSYGLGQIAQTWLQRWEAANAARYKAWSSAPTVAGGVTAVVGTAGAMFGASPGSGGLSLSAVAKWATGTPAAGIAFR